MITNSIIKDCFDCLVGWKESAGAGTCFDALSDHLKHSESGIYVNDLPAVRLEIINDAMGKDQNAVNDYLSELYEDSSVKVARAFVLAHKKFNYAKALLDNFDYGIYAQNIRTRQNKRSRFVGFEIIPRGGNSVNAQVMQFGGMFMELQETLPIYFYSSKQAEPLIEFNANINKVKSLVWFDLTQQASGSGSDDCTSILEIIAKHINTDSGHGARYYIGYYEDDLDANNYAVYTNANCFSGCNSKLKTVGTYATIRPIEVPSGNTYEDRTLFDLDNVGYSPTETYGLHLKVNVTCDISSIICDNKMLFAEAHRLQQAITILWDCYNSTALNVNMASKKEDFKLMAEKYELDLADVLKSLTVDFSNVDPICVGSKKGVMGLMNL